jgi:hypothetical protein
MSSTCYPESFIHDLDDKQMGTNHGCPNYH